MNYSMKAWRRILHANTTRMNILDHSTLNKNTVFLERSFMEENNNNYARKIAKVIMKAL